MDGTSFDRMARLLGGTTTRRGGIFAAAAVALGLKAASEVEDVVVAADAADEDVDAEKKRKRCKPSRGEKGKKSADVAGEGMDAESDAEAEKKKRRKSRCKKSSQCCSLICKGKRRKKRKKKHHKGGKKDILLSGLLASDDDLDEFGFDEEGYEDYAVEDDEDDDEDGITPGDDVEAEKHRRKRRRRRFCRCRKEGATCKVDQNCCNGRACVNGRCKGTPKGKIPTGQSCKASTDTCQDTAAVCTVYSSGQPSGTYCLLANGDACSGNADCISQDCASGVCRGGVAPIPTGQACTQSDTCEASAATCTTYSSGQPTGTYCLLPNGEACQADGDCVSDTCRQGICVLAPVATSKFCTVGVDSCEDSSATCTRYTAPANPQGNFCVLPDGQACTTNDDCESAFCNPSTNVCGACSLTENGQACTADADCCSGICIVHNGKGVCISSRTIWAVNEWTRLDVDIDTFIWLPQSVPTDDEIADAATTGFPQGGDWVMFSNDKYPASWSDTPQTPVPDVVLDVDMRDAPGVERILIWNPVPGGTYRFALQNYDYCTSDDGSTNACGDNWSGWYGDGDPTFMGPNYDNTVTFWEGNTKKATYYLPTSVPQGVDADHIYWWHVVDFTFGPDGFVSTFSHPDGSNGGPLSACCPNPYPMGSYDDGEYSNYCTPA